MIQTPKFEDSVFIAENAVIKGNVKAGKECSFWFGSVTRSEHAAIQIGDRVNIQDQAVLHTDPGFDLLLENGVSVGHGAILHGCQIGENTIVGMGAIVMNGAHVGKNSIVAAGSVIPEGKVYEDGMLILGSPARAIRPLSLQEIEQNKANAQEYVQLAAQYRKEESQ